MRLPPYLARCRCAVLADPPESFRQHLCSWKLLLTLIGLFILSDRLSQLWIVNYQGIRSMEAFQHALAPTEARVCRIINIDEQDYNELFDGRSPLSPVVLSRALSRILEMAPAVLAVNIDTSSHYFRNMVLPHTNVPVVWARDGIADQYGIKPRPILGGRGADNERWGFTLFPRSPDWSVREYPRQFKVGTRLRPSFHWAVVQAYCEVSHDPICGSVVATSRDGGQLSVPAIHSMYKVPEIPMRDLPASGHSIRAENPLSRKIVLVGGSYATTDNFPTAFGVVTGVHIVGSAVEAELDPRRPSRLGDVGKYVLKFLLALLVAAAHHYLRPRYALLATILILGGMVVLGSFIAVYISSYRADFVPFLVGIWIEQLFEGSEHSHHLSQQHSLQTNHTRGN